jgi:hypothetical protein
MLMNRILLIVLLTASIFGSIDASTNPVIKMKSTCTGSKNCNACKNCKYCKHCAKDGGKCGICK